MISRNPQAGTACLRWSVLAAGLLALTAGQELFAQEKLERPKTDEFTKFDAFKRGDVAVVVEGNPAATAQNQQLLDKVARWYALRLNDQKEKDNLSDIQRELTRRVVVTNYARLNSQQRQYVDEFGKVMVRNLEGLALRAGRPIVRVNAARMAAEVGRMGYDGAAELYLKILEKPEESDAVRLWALEGLGNLFAIVPEPAIAPAKTVFQKKNDAVLTPLELRSIKALIAFIQRKNELPEGTTSEEVEAIRYVRRAAIRALGKVRVQTARNLGQPDSRPALELLKVARRDLPAPPASAAEMVEAIVGFCSLHPDQNRDLQLDYAVWHIGQAINEIVVYRVNNLSDTSIPWKATAGRLREALETWKKESEGMKLQDAKLVDDLLQIADQNILRQIEEGTQGNPPNSGPLADWLSRNPPKSKSLFKSDEKTTINTK